MAHWYNPDPSKICLCGGKINMELILYSNNCPKCKVLKKKLESANIAFEVCEDLDVVIEKGFKTLPVLFNKNDGKFMTFTEAVAFINNNMKG